MNMTARLVFFFFLSAWAAFVPPAGAREAFSSELRAESALVVEAAFSPRGNALGLILKTIALAEKSIYVAAFPFTSHAVSEALLQAKKRGVEVKIVADREAGADKPAVLGFLAGRGVGVRLNGEYATLHHKFMVIDGRHVQTGSFNYTKSAAERNAENVLVVWNSPVTAGLYKAEWQRLWNEGTVLKARGKRRE